MTDDRFSHRDVVRVRTQLHTWLGRCLAGPERVDFDGLVDAYLVHFDSDDPGKVSQIDLLELVAEFEQGPPPQTGTPCPTWCSLDPGHAYLSHDDEGRWWRWHRSTVGMVSDAYIEMQCLERQNGDGAVFLEMPHVRLFDVEDMDLEAPDLRRLAAELLNAADRLDEVPVP